jgi:hypothetical protein
MTYYKNIDASIRDSANLDAFNRLRVSNPTNVFDAQLTYDLKPTVFEQITNGSGAAIAHNATDKCATLTFASTPTGGKAIMQTYEYFSYQPMKSQLIGITFNMVASVSNVVKFAGYSDGNNGVEFQNDGTNNRVVLYSDTTNGDQTINQSSWNLDTLDGSGASGITLDITKTQILIIDLQALYAGRVRVGFNIGGVIVYVHEFNHSNTASYPYIQTANLPIRCGMTSTGTVSTTIEFICSSVVSEGGQEFIASFDLVQSASVSAGNGSDTHLLSLRPKTTFAGVTNRARIIVEEFELTVTGASPVLWKLCIGQSLTTPSYADVNTTHSAVEYDTAGTLDGSPAIVVNSGYVPATTQVKNNFITSVLSRYPITLDSTGANRDLGTMTVIVQGIGGASQCYGTLKWREIR